MPRLSKMVFFGTPEFALPTLEALQEAGKTPVLVVTQPPRPAGRGRRVQDPPVARWAKRRGIDVRQPESVKDPAFLEEVAALKPDLAVVVAFGQIFPPELLALPKHGCVNLHASLLPKYRGAAPIQAAILAGERKTGVTTMLMEKQLDAGPILLQEATEIGPHETAGKLAKRLAEMGAQLMVQTLEGLGEGKLKPRKQREELASYAPRISKDLGKVDWALDATALYNRLRACTPWPGLTTHFRGQPLKIVWGVPVDWEEVPSGLTGTYLGLRQGRLAVLCGDGTLFGIEEVQRPGRKPIRAPDFLNSERLRVGELFA